MIVPSNLVSNHTRNCQIKLPLRGRSILLITRMITDRIRPRTFLITLFIGREKQGEKRIRCYTSKQNINF